MGPLTSYLMRAFLSDLPGATVTSTDRSYAQQLKLWYDYLAGRRKDRPAMPGSSRHEWGSAFDFTFPNYSMGQDREGERAIREGATAYWLKVIIESDHFHAQADVTAIERESRETAIRYSDELYGPVLTGTPLLKKETPARRPWWNALPGLIGGMPFRANPLESMERQMPWLPALTEYLVRFRGLVL